MSYNNTGPYNNSTTYYLNDIVSYNKSTFLCVNDNTGYGVSEIIPESNKLVELYAGPELISGGTFDNSLDWNTTATISDGVCEIKSDDYLIQYPMWAPNFKDGAKLSLFYTVIEENLNDSIMPGPFYMGFHPKRLVKSFGTPIPYDIGFNVFEFIVEGTSTADALSIAVNSLYPYDQYIIIDNISLREAVNVVVWKLYSPETEVVMNDKVIFVKKEVDRFTTDDYTGVNILKPRLDKIELPTDDDYKNGYMYRYFFRQSNNTQSDIHEICKKEYDKISNYYFYTALKTMWKIIGEKSSTLKTNLIIIRNANDKLNGIKDILSQNPLQYWKDLPDIISENMDVTDKIIAKRESEIYDLTQEFIKHIENKTITTSAEYNLIKDEFLRESEVEAVTVGVLEYSAELDPNRYLTTENDDIILTEDYQAIVVEDRT